MLCIGNVLFSIFGKKLAHTYKTTAIPTTTLDTWPDSSLLYVHYVVLCTIFPKCFKLNFNLFVFCITDIAFSSNAKEWLKPFNFVVTVMQSKQKKTLVWTIYIATNS